MKKLVVISHTEHQTDVNGRVMGWGPTINEINYLAQFWDEVVHVGCLEKEEPKGSSLPYRANNIRLAPIPPFGGKTLWQKLGIIAKAPRILRTIRASVQQASHVQLRLPMGIGLFVLPWFFFRRRSAFIFWVKYANNWGQPHPPIGYGIQRWMLKKNFARCKVTINGFWPQQPPHCLSFENPSLSDNDISKGRAIAREKRFNPPFQFIFIGRIEKAKGISDLLSAMATLPARYIHHVHIVGSGPMEVQIQNEFKKNGISHTLHGFLPKENVFSLLEQCHFLCLPSESEGFPKVVSEGACFSCIPVVSDVGSIGHYIKHKLNGFVWDRSSPTAYAQVLLEAVTTDADVLEKIANQSGDLAGKFTFEHYYKRLSTEVFA